MQQLKIDKADRFSHIVNGGSDEQKRKRTTWGEQLKRYFTELAQSKYTEDVEQEIDDAIENIENSMRTIGVIK